MYFSLVIPVYNEQENIITLLTEIVNTLPFDKFNYEIVIVNDASTDNSLKEIEIFSKKFTSNFKILNNKKNLGQSKSLHKGISLSQYDTIVSIDGDGQNNPTDIPKLLNIYKSMPDVYLLGGLRLKRKDSLVKRISSKIANKIRSYILKDDCIDTGCSLKVFDKSIFLNLPYFNGIHRFLPALFKGFQKKTYFVEVDHRPRNFGNSKYGTFNRLLRGIIDIVKVLIIINKYNKKND